jgi:hypothetical protein
VSGLSLIALVAGAAGVAWLATRLALTKDPAPKDLWTKEIWPKGVWPKGVRTKGVRNWNPCRFEAHRARALDGSPVSQLELRLAGRDGRGWRLYCSVVLARGQDRPAAALPISSGQPPARGL